jgi:hypothetical protein
MQKIATRVFIIASIVFGVLGILMVITAPFGEGETASDLNQTLQKLLMITVFIILPSFALSLAGKYLNGKH